jgi:hypothetical protein
VRRSERGNCRAHELVGRRAREVCRVRVVHGEATVSSSSLVANKARIDDGGETSNKWVCFLEFTNVMLISRGEMTFRCDEGGELQPTAAASFRNLDLIVGVGPSAR